MESIETAPSVEAAVETETGVEDAGVQEATVEEASATPEEDEQPDPDYFQIDAPEAVDVADGVPDQPDPSAESGRSPDEPEEVTAPELSELPSEGDDRVDADVDGVLPGAEVQPVPPAEMGGLPVEDWDYQEPKRGQVRRGVILSIGEQQIIVGVGAKRDGIVPYADMQRLGPEAVADLSVGDEVRVFVLRPEDQDGDLLVSLYQARQVKDWERAAELAESGEILEGEVIGYNKGGLVIPVENIRGFVPASQVPGFPQSLGQEEKLGRLAEKVGEKLQVKVIEINRRNRRLILSATAAQRDWRKIQRKRLLEELREGEVRSGRISSLCSFGAFVDLGGADGLVHLSELSWRRVRHPREVANVGDEVEVYVLRLDKKRKRIGLSLKRLQPEPWALVEDRYELGQLVEGTVTNVVDFGAFAEIEEGVEGLIHVSELADAPISHPRDVVNKGDLLLLRIIRIDIRRRRLGLSLKRVLEAEWADWAARVALAEAEKAAEAGVPDEIPEVPEDGFEEAEELEATVVEPPADEEAEEAEELDELEATVVEPPADEEPDELEPAGAEGPEAAELAEPEAALVEESVELVAGLQTDDVVVVAVEGDEPDELSESLHPAEVEEPIVGLSEEDSNAEAELGATAELEDELAESPEVSETPVVEEDTAPKADDDGEPLSASTETDDEGSETVLSDGTEPPPEASELLEVEEVESATMVLEEFSAVPASDETTAAEAESTAS